MHSHSPLPAGGRALTTEEHLLARWMLEHGIPEAASFLPQLEHVRVVSQCLCGCASIDFALVGSPVPTGGMHVLGDFLFGSKSTLSGAFIFEKGGLLAGLEVYGLAGPAPSVLPTPSALRSYEEPEPE